MTATYPSLLAGGITAQGRFDPFDLFAGESDIVTNQYQAADGQAISQFQVCTLNAAGRLIPMATAGDYAAGTITVATNPTAADTLTINSVVLTFRATATVADEITIGSTTTITAANIAAAINADPERFGMSATQATNVVTVTAVSSGTAGNAITMAKSGTHPTLSAATLTGANAVEDVPSGNAVAIAAQAVAAATPGAYCPVFTGGQFNHEALVWPAGIVTLGDRKATFAGSNIGVTQLL